MNLRKTAVWFGASAAVSLLPQVGSAQTAKPPAAPTNPAATAAPPPPPATATAFPAPGPPPPAAPAPAPAAAPPAAPATEPAPATAAPAPAPIAPAPTAPPPIALPPLQSAPPSGLAPGSEEAAPREREHAKGGSALNSSPFMDATLNGTWLEDRFGDPFVFGVQGGAYFGGIVRAAIRLEMPTDNARDDYSDYDYDSAPVPGGPVYTSSYARNSDPPTLLYGGSLGVVATSSENFVFAPGVVFVRSDVADYGNMLGISMPFEWVTARGMRFGLELDLGRAFGGKVHNQTCSVNSSTGAQVCSESTIDRPAGRAFALRFEMGFGFKRPR